VKKAVLALGGLLLAGSLASCAQAAKADSRTVDITIHYSHFHPDHLSFPAGTSVTFVIHNNDPIDHEFILGPQWVQDYIEHTDHPAHDGSVAGQISVPAGETRSTTYTLTRTVPFACHLPGHYAFGMRGSVTVTG
jgi:uncharacterized cupredoxin-like copper-binding protein